MKLALAVVLSFVGTLFGFVGRSFHRASMLAYACGSAALTTSIALTREEP